jgi:RHS repeat-associated protein
MVSFQRAPTIVGSRSYYEPYGQPLSSPDEGQPSFTGHQFDASTGLIQAQQRFLDPNTGRFLSSDPSPVNTASAANFNRYAYGNNNPYKFIDPNGRDNVLNIVVQIDPGSPVAGNLTTEHIAAQSAAQRSVDLTVAAVMKSGTSEQKASLKNWTVSIDPSSGPPPGVSKKSVVAITTFYPDEGEGYPETIDTSFGGNVAKLTKQNMQHSDTRGMKAKGGNPALLMTGAHEFVGHGNKQNDAVPEGPAREEDAKDQTWPIVKNADDIEPGDITCKGCE